MSSTLDLAGVQGLDDEVTLDAEPGCPYFLITAGNGSPVKVAPGAYHLLRGVRAGRSFESLAGEFTARGGRPVSAQEIAAAYERVASRLSSIGEVPAARSLPPGFWLRVPLLPAALVGRLAGRLAVAFHPLAAALLLAFMALSLVPVIRHGLSVPLRGGPLWGGYLLFTAYLLVHELGHAAACARYGARPSDIGFAFYLIYPAFYSDVTAAWRLRRWQRVAVDLGGMYFQLVAASFGSVAFLIWGWEPFRVAVVLSWYSVLFSLNPIFRFDGYWVLADSVGVTNLGRQPAIIFRSLVARLRGREAVNLGRSWWLTGTLALYSVAACLVWGFFVWHLAPFLLQATIDFPRSVVALATLLAGGTPPRVLGDRAAMLLANFFVLAITWYGISRLLVKSVFRPLYDLRRRWTLRAVESA